jgi:hypothetical protein
VQHTWQTQIFGRLKSANLQLKLIKFSFAKCLWMITHKKHPKNPERAPQLWLCPNKKTQKEHHNYDCVQTKKPRKSTTIMIVSKQKTQKEHHNYDCVQTKNPERAPQLWLCPNKKPRKSTTIMIVSSNRFYFLFCYFLFL